jgi:hypothetical protein
VVKKAVDPVNGIPAECKAFLPTGGQISEWLVKKQDWMAKYNYGSSKPLPKPRYHVRMNAPEWPNVWVPKNAPGYDLAYQFGLDAPAKYYRRKNDYRCANDEVWEAICVPLSWWERREYMNYRQWIESLTERKQIITKSMTSKETGEFKKKFEITDEQWDAVPKI